MSDYQPTTTDNEQSLNEHDQKVEDYWRRLKNGEDPTTFTEDDTIGMDGKATKTEDQEKANLDADSSGPSEHNDDVVEHNTESTSNEDDTDGPGDNDQDSTIDDSNNVDNDDVSSPGDRNYKQMYDELLTLYSKEQHKSSSWNGRIKAANKRASELEAENKQLKDELSALKSSKASESTKSETKQSATGKQVDISALEDVIKDFEGVDDEVVNTWNQVKERLTHNPVSTKDVTKTETNEDNTKSVDSTTATIDDDDVPVDDYTNNLMTAIRTKHPDVDLLINGGEQSKLATWVNTYPDMFKRPVMAAIYNGGTAADIIALIDLYKQETSKPKTQSAKNLLGPTSKQQLIKPMKNKQVAPRLINEQDPRWQQQYDELWAKEKARRIKK